MILIKTHISKDSISNVLFHLLNFKLSKMVETSGFLFRFVHFSTKNVHNNHKWAGLHTKLNNLSPTRVIGLTSPDEITFSGGKKEGEKTQKKKKNDIRRSPSANDVTTE